MKCISVFLKEKGIFQVNNMFFMFEKMLISDVDLTNTEVLYIILRNKNDTVFNIIL